MRVRLQCFAATVFLFLFCLLGLQANENNLKDNLKKFRGKVVSISAVDKALNVNSSPALEKHYRVLAMENNKMLAIFPDDRAKMFFTDPQVLNRPMIITGRVLPEIGMLQIIDINSVRGDKTCDIYYWCDICAIRRSSGGTCECCGDPMVLKEVPLR